MGFFSFAYLDENSTFHQNVSAIILNKTYTLERNSKMSDINNHNLT